MRKRETVSLVRKLNTEVDAICSAANNNTRTIWQGSVGSVGVLRHGEFYIVILRIPERSCMFFGKSEYGKLED
jgi:hypothetical protein